MVNKAIVNAYVRRIQRGAITIDNVPASIRPDVQEALDELNKTSEEENTNENQLETSSAE